MGKKKKARLLETVTEKLELDAGNICGEFELTVSGDRRAVICGVRAVLRYEPELVMVSCRDQTVTVTGSDFTLNTFDGDCLSVTGEITGITLE